MIRVENLGTFWAFLLETPEEIDWVKEKVWREPWQWTGPNRFLVDHRFAGEMALGMRAAGFDVGPCEKEMEPDEIVTKNLLAIE